MAKKPTGRRWKANGSMESRLSGAMRAAEQSPKPGDGSPEGAVRLLLVCRHAGMRNALRRLLAQRWEVECVASGSAALEIARSRPLDFMICELELSGLDGLQVLRELRNHPRTWHVPFILVVPPGCERSCIEALEQGADDYIRKPFSAREVLARVELRLSHGKFRATERLARLAAEQANRAKDEFLAVLSHELRNPLSAMVEWISVLRTEQTPRAESARALELLAFSLGMQQRLLDDLRDVARIVSGRLLLRRRPIPCLSVIVNAIVDLFRPIAAKKEIRLHATVAPNSGPLYADAERLQQVVWNLISNAVKFTPAGGRVEVRCHCIRGAVELRVRDTGVGLTAEAMPHLFERFWRGGHAYEGLGLGLSIVAGIAKLHGGTVHARSAGANRGATFTVRLPIAVHPGVTELSARSKMAGAVSERRIRILLVEDHLETAKAIQRLLIGTGHSVRHESSIAGALRAAAERVFDVLICDLNLRDGSGLDLLPRIREFLPRSSHDTGRAPAIVLSGYVDDASAARSLAAGFAKHLEKPIDSPVLLQAVQEVAATSSAPRTLEA